MCHAKLRKMFTFFALIWIFVVKSSISKEHLCNTDYNKDKLLSGKPNCGDFQCRCESNIAFCVGNRTTDVIPNLDDTIDTLHVKCYGMSSFNQSSIAHIRHLNLKTLVLTRNEISIISDDIFDDFENLTFVGIIDNMNVNHSSLYKALGSLQKKFPSNLTFNNIDISNLSDEFLKSLNTSNVYYLSLAGNKIKTVNLTVFSKLKQLQELYLNKNWIRNTSGEGQLESLLTLDLSENRLKFKQFRFCVGKGMSVFPKLRRLILDSNFFNFLGKQFSESLNCLSTLEVLSLNDNELRSIDMSFFTNLNSLREIHLASNWITFVNPADLPSNLNVLNFHKNEFVVFPPRLCEGLGNHSYTSVKVLNFSSNYIAHLTTENFKCLPNLEVMDFSRNDVTALKDNTFANFTSLATLYLDNMIHWMRMIETNAFNSSSLKKLGLRFNGIDFRKEIFHDIFQSCPNIRWIDISYNIFLDLQEKTVLQILSPMKSLDYLRAQRISLRKFPSTFLTHFKELKHLDINKNLLDTVQFPKQFNDASLNLSIRHISVAENRINSIDEWTFPSSITASLEELDMSNNEFACTCKMRWFRDQISMNGKIGQIRLLKWPHEYVCRSPTKLVGILFRDYEPDENCNPIKPIVVVFITVGSCLFVFTVFFSTAYWNRWYIQYYWYKITRRRRDSNSNDLEEQSLLDEIRYDAYVVYHPEDGHFVHHSFLNLMEQNLNYNLHIWERNAENGALVDVMLDAMYSSRQVIVIVSNKLMKDQWCKFQVDVAIDRSIELGNTRILLVELENIDFRMVSKAWCVLLTKNPKAQWSDADDDDDIRKTLFKQTVRRQLGEPLTHSCN